MLIDRSVIAVNNPITITQGNITGDGHGVMFGRGISVTLVSIFSRPADFTN
jgi:hypothetical protein